MPIVSPSSRGAFNGGTVTSPLVVAPSTINATGVEIKPKTGGTVGFPALAIDKYDGTLSVTHLDDDGGGVIGGLNLGESGSAVLTSTDAATGNPLVSVVESHGSSILTLQTPGGGFTLTVASRDAADEILSVAAWAGQTARLQSWYDENFARVAAVSPTGRITATGIAANPLTSGALPTVAPVSGTAFQCSTTRDVFLVVPVTYNPTAGAAATCLVQVSPDNVTFSTVGTETEPAGVAFDGTIHLLTLQVPAAWRVKLTVVNATLGTGTYY